MSRDANSRPSPGSPASLPDELWRIWLGWVTCAVRARAGAGNTWTQQRVVSLRHTHDIPVYTPGVDGIALTIGQAADHLGVSTTTVRKLIMSGQLPATQPVPYAPWTIQPDDLTTAGIQRVVRAVKAGRRLPQTLSGTQLPLINPPT